MEAAIAGGRGARTNRFSFIEKLAAAAALVALADWLFFLQRLGSTVGLFALALLLALLLVRPALRHGAARVSLVAGLAYAQALADDPSLLAAALFWTAATLAVLIPKRRFDDGWSWAKRLLIHWICLPYGLVGDGWRLRAVRHRRGAVPLTIRLRPI